MQITSPGTFGPCHATAHFDMHPAGVRESEANPLWARRLPLDALKSLTLNDFIKIQSMARALLEHHTGNP
jgi:hypothetical protein